MSSRRSRFANLRTKQSYTSQVQRESRAQKKLQDRRDSRAIGFGRNRNIGDLKEKVHIELAQNKLAKDPQRLKLERWKEERKKQKLANAKKKPAFVCGVVKHSVGSPYSSKASSTALKADKLFMYPKTTITSHRNQRACTRARETEKQQSDLKREALVTIPKNFKFTAPKGIKPLTIPSQPLKPNNTASNKRQPDAIVLQRVTRSMMAKTAQNDCKLNSLQNAQSKTSVMAESVAHVTDAVEATTMVMESVPLNQENSVCEAKENVTELEGTAICTPDSKISKDNAEYVPVHYSPFVTKERGSARKSHSSRDCAVTPLKERSLNVEKQEETEKEHEGIVYFRNVLQSEVERLDLISEKWLTLRNSTPDLPEEICDLIDVAVGKARLLIKQKLNQFGTLINQCEAGSVPGMPGVTVKCSDLEGFWDMVYMQVEDVDTKFKMLEDAKSKNWQEDDVPSAQIPAKRERKKPAGKGKKEVAKSSLRSMIAAARKKKQNAADDAPELVTPKKFATPIIVNHSSARKSMLQQVLTTEAYKQGLTENPTASMIELSGIRSNFSTPILLRNDGNTDLEQHGILSNKASTTIPKRASQSFRKSMSRKVRFTEEENISEEKPVQPMTPYVTGTGLKRRRRSSTINSEERKNLQKSPLSPDINQLSPIERPSRVLRRSRRLNDI